MMHVARQCHGMLALAQGACPAGRIAGDMHTMQSEAEALENNLCVSPSTWEEWDQRSLASAQSLDEPATAK